MNPEANRVVGLQEHLFASLLQISGNSSSHVLDIYCRSGNNLSNLPVLETKETAFNFTLGF